MAEEKERIKDGKKYAIGMRSGIFGLLVNAVLFAAKFTVGILSGSISATADAFNNLSDGASSAITVAGYRLSARPADREHPYGHARFEYVAALIVAVFMFVIGALFLKESLVEIFAGKGTPDVGVYLYIVLGLSVAAKGAQAAVYGAAYKKTKSLPMRAAMQDSLGDMLATTGAILSAVIWDVAKVDADGYFGAAISAFILFTAIRLMREGISPLLGSAPSAESVNALKGKILSYDGVLGVHDLVLHSYGDSRVYAVAHIEVSPTETLLSAHELADRIERDVLGSLGVSLVAHIDPRSEEKGDAAHREMLSAFLAARFAGLTVHDFRITEEDGDRHAYFDAEIPYESTVTEDGILSALREFDPNCEYVVKIDRR